jgi:hypothetical protein
MPFKVSPNKGKPSCCRPHGKGVLLGTLGYGIRHGRCLRSFRTLRQPHLLARPHKFPPTPEGNEADQSGADRTTGRTTQTKTIITYLIAGLSRAKLFPALASGLHDGRPGNSGREPCLVLRSLMHSVLLEGMDLSKCIAVKPEGLSFATKEGKA